MGSLTGLSIYLSGSWVGTGVVQGHARIDASGAVVEGRSGRFMFPMVRVWRLRLEPLLATGPRTGRQITPSLPLIYRASKGRAAVEFLGQEHSVGRPSREWHVAVEVLGQEHSVGWQAAVALVW